MEDLTIAIEVDGIPCVFDRTGLDSPVMVHKVAKMQQAFRDLKDGEAPKLSPLDMDYIGERIFGTEQWENILYSVEDKGIAYTWHFIMQAMSQVSEKAGEVKNS